MLNFDDMKVVPLVQRATVYLGVLTRDGKKAGVCLADGEYIFVYDSTTGKVLHRLAGHEARVNSLAFSPDSRYLASGGADEMIIVWDIATGKESFRLIPKQRTTTCLTYSIDGKMLYAFGTDGKLQCFDTSSRKLKWETTSVTKKGLQSLTFSKNNQIVVGSGLSGVIQIWDADTGAEKFRRQVHVDTITSIVNMRKINVLTSLSEGGDCRLWDVMASRAVRKLARTVSAIAGSETDPKLYFASGDDVFVADLSQKDHAEQLLIHSASGVLSLAILEGTNLLVAGCDDGSIRVFDIKSGREQRRLLANEAGRQFFKVVPDSDVAVLVEDDGLTLWNISSGTRIWKARLFKADAVRDLAVSADGRVIAILTASGEVQLVDRANGGAINRLALKSLDVTSIAFHGPMLAVGCKDGNVRMQDYITGEWKSLLQGHRGAVSFILSSSFSRTLFSGGADTTVLKWDFSRENAPKNERRLTSKEGVTLLNDLASEDIAIAYGSLRRLSSSPDAACSALKEHIHKAEYADPAKVQNLLAALKSDRFANREAARRQLIGLGDAVGPFIEERWKDGDLSNDERQLLETIRSELGKMTPEKMKQSRAIQLLEHLGTSEAIEHLRFLALGSSTSITARESRSALRRLGCE